MCLFLLTFPPLSRVSLSWSWCCSQKQSGPWRCCGASPDAGLWRCSKCLLSITLFYFLSLPKSTILQNICSSELLLIHEEQQCDDWSLPGKEQRLSAPADTVGECMCTYMWTRPEGDLVVPWQQPLGTPELPGGAEQESGV